MGSQLTVILHVDNNGTGTANNVSPTTFIQGGGGNLVAFIGPTPAFTILGPGTGQDFFYTFSANGAGSVYFSMGATGSDVLTTRVSNLTVTSAVILQTPASLSGLLIAPATVDVNQPLLVNYSLTNSSGPQGETAYSLSPTTALLAIAGAAASPTGPFPVGVSLTGGASTNYFYYVTAPASAGLNTLTEAVTGTAQNPGLSVTDTRPLQTILVQIGASLTAGVSAQPLSPNASQLFTVTFNITNIGQANLANVVPAMISSGAGTIQQLSAPSSLGSLGGGGNAIFQWSFSATGVGQHDFTVSASGIDVNTGATITASLPVSVFITPQQASLATSSLVNPSVVGLGGLVTVSVQVTNTGLAGCQRRQRRGQPHGRAQSWAGQRARRAGDAGRQRRQHQLHLHLQRHQRRFVRVHHPGLGHGLHAGPAQQQP